MEDMDIINGRKILVVDDEPDIPAVLEELLNMCVIDKAPDFSTAQDFLEKNRYDAAILDIMGVKGYELLDITTKKGIPTLMLTAHALTPDNLVKSIKKGAHAFVPKEKITDIAIFLKDVLEASQMGEKGFGQWFSRLGDYFDEKFGYYWKEKTEEDPDFWKNAY